MYTLYDFYSGLDLDILYKSMQKFIQQVYILTHKIFDFQ